MILSSVLLELRAHLVEVIEREFGLLLQCVDHLIWSLRDYGSGQLSLRTSLIRELDSGLSVLHLGFY